MNMFWKPPSTKRDDFQIFNNTAGFSKCNFFFQMADTSKGRHTLGRAAQDISHFLGYVLGLHGLGMWVSADLWSE